MKSDIVKPFPDTENVSLQKRPGLALESIHSGAQCHDAQDVSPSVSDESLEDDFFCVKAPSLNGW